MVTPGWLKRRWTRSLQSGGYLSVTSITFALLNEFYTLSPPIFSDSEADRVLSLIFCGGVMLGAAGLIISPTKPQPEDANSVTYTLSSGFYIAGHALLIAGMVYMCDGENNVPARIVLFSLTALGSLWSLWKDPLIVGKNTDPAIAGLIQGGEEGGRLRSVSF